MAVKVALVYPFFHPANDNSIFRFPPLGLGYIAAALERQGVEVELVDCTFLKPQQAIERVVHAKPQVVGFYCMFSMKKTTLELAQNLRAKLPKECMFVVGGPLPSWAPEAFLGVFDAVAVGEGEQTMVELTQCLSEGKALSSVKGLVYREEDRTVTTPARPFIEDLDSLFSQHANTSTTTPTRAITKKASATQPPP